MLQIRSLFATLNINEPGTALRSRILARIREEEFRLFLRYRKLSVAGIFVSSLVLLFGGVRYGEALFQSEFWTLASLLFSDLSVIASSFQDFAYSLLETLPIVPFFAFLAPLALFFWSVSILLSLSEKDHSRNMRSSLLAHS